MLRILRCVLAHAPEDVFEVPALQLQQPGLHSGGGLVLLADPDIPARRADGLDHQLNNVVHYAGVTAAFFADYGSDSRFSGFDLAPNPFIFAFFARSRKEQNRYLLESVLDYFFSYLYLYLFLAGFPKRLNRFRVFRFWIFRRWLNRIRDERVGAQR